MHSDIDPPAALPDVLRNIGTGECCFIRMAIGVVHVMRLVGTGPYDPVRVVVLAGPTAGNTATYAANTPCCARATKLAEHTDAIGGLGDPT